MAALALSLRSSPGSPGTLMTPCLLIMATLSFTRCDLNSSIRSTSFWFSMCWWASFRSCEIFLDSSLVYDAELVGLLWAVAEDASELVALASLKLLDPSAGRLEAPAPRKSSPLFSSV